MRKSLYWTILLCIFIGCDGISQVISTNISNGSSVITEGVNIYRRRGLTNSLYLPEGKQLIINGVNFSYSSSYSGGMSGGFIRKVIGTNNFVDIFYGSKEVSNTSWYGPIIGPMSIEYGLYDGGFSVEDFPQTFCNLLFEIKDDPFQETTVSGSAGSSFVTVQNSNGQTDVFLEQSSDLITWSQCLPGSYNAATQKRFFRVRTVEK